MRPRRRATGAHVHGPGRSHVGRRLIGFRLPQTTALIDRPSGQCVQECTGNFSLCNMSVEAARSWLTKELPVLPVVVSP